MKKDILKNDFSSYSTGAELVERADKNIIKRAVLLKKQLRENRTVIVTVQNSKILTHA